MSEEVILLSPKCCNAVSCREKYDYRRREVARWRNLSFTTSKPNYYELHLKMCYKCLSKYVRFYKNFVSKSASAKIRSCKNPPLQKSPHCKSPHLIKVCPLADKIWPTRYPLGPYLRWGPRCCVRVEESQSCLCCSRSV